MKFRIVTGLVAITLMGSGRGSRLSAEPADADKPVPVSITISKRKPIPFESVRELSTYASSNNFYFPVRLREGMKVLFSASYGMGNEAGQAEGVIIRKNGHFYFRMKNNPTMQLLLPPGLTFNSGTKDSLWDIEAYLNLVNRVVFSEPNEASKTGNDVYVRGEAALVDFKGGTAGKTVTYKDAMEVGFKSNNSRSQSNFKVYYAKGTGPVALEFTENKTPSGTFKFYIGD